MYDDFDEYEDYDFEDIGLYEHKRSDKVKWIISFLLIFVLLCLICMFISIYLVD